MSDDEYVEGDSTSEAADAPGQVPADDDIARGPKQGGFDSSSVTDAPVLKKHTNAQRTAASRKAFAEAVLANKQAEKMPSTPNEADELDPEAAPAAPAESPVARSPQGDIAAAKAAGAPLGEAALPPKAAAPAPSLDPEVRELMSRLKSDQAKFEERVAAWEKEHAKAPATEAATRFEASLEDYIDNSPRAYRSWLETMRGEKFASDDDFKEEVKDFVTQLSSDVLGVPLPESVKIAFDAAQAKKIVRTHKTILAKKEAAAAAKAEAERTAAIEKAETERLEVEWTKAASNMSRLFVPTTDAEGRPVQSSAAKTYPWLAAEDDPGKAIVDVIRAAMNRDGTQLSWQEAGKLANDYLADQAKRYFNKRKPLLSDAPTAVAAAAKPKAAVAPPAEPRAAEPRITDAPAPKVLSSVVDTSKKWSRERHMESTKAAFRAARAAEPK